MTSFSAELRRQRIIEILRSAGGISVTDLIERSGVSPATVRRDLKDLEKQACIQKTRGGVWWIEESTGEETSHQRRAVDSPKEKRMIAESAAEMLPEQAAVFLDSGTTCLALAELIGKRPRATIYTNSLAIAWNSPSFAARTILLGGECRAVSLALVGTLAENQIRSLRFDFCFLGATAVDSIAGAYTTEISEAGIKSAAIQSSRKAILLADSSKAKVESCARFAEWKDIDLWITDGKLSPAKAKEFPVKIHRTPGKAAKQ